MSISILGAGNVGMALARAFVAKGESVRLGVPEPAKYHDAVAKLGPAASVGTTADAIATSDVIILAVPYGAAGSIARAVRDWKGRILVDATNPLAPGLAGLTVGTTTSGAEEIAKAAKGARVVKAFNTTGAENMEDAHYPGGSVFMPVCGDDADARARREGIQHDRRREHGRCALSRRQRVHAGLWGRRRRARARRGACDLDRL